MKTKNQFAVAGVCGLLTAILTGLVLLVDIAPIGPEGTSIGLSHCNQAIHDLFGVNMFWYHLTDWLGKGAILVALLFAAVGFMQLIRRKSLLKVDREILALGGLYVVVIGLYAFFERVIVNYRPILMPGCDRPEASFPSSHTMLVCVVMGSAMMVMDKYIKEKALCRALRVVCALVIGITVVGRLISGVHWFTDIIAGLLFSATLLALFSGIAPCRPSA